MTSPASQLLAAADRIRDLAADTASGDWTFESFAPAIRREGDARWIAALSPAVATHLEAILRRAAADIVVHVPAWNSRPRPDGEVERLTERQFGGALGLARAVLGSGVDTHAHE
jgi:hypothetical protein